MKFPAFVHCAPRLWCLSLLILGSACLFARPDTVKVGAFITNLYDIDLADRSFHTDFWVWFVYDDPELAPLETMEIPRLKDVEYTLPYVETKGGKQWATQKVRTTIRENFDVRDFPFDVQLLEIEIEESDADTSGLVYVADVTNTKYDERISLTGWYVRDFGIQQVNKAYQTNYGDPVLGDGESVYPNVLITMILERKSFGLFLTLFTGLYVAFFISMLVFWIDPVDVDPRFGLSVGGLFAAVGNKYIVDSLLPQSASFTLVDILHVVTYVSLLVCIILSVYSLRLWKSRRRSASRRLDRWAFWGLMALYVLINVAFIIRAASHDHF